MNIISTYLLTLSKRKPSLKAHGKKAFWAWITYQTVKGTLTTSLIWVPLLVTLWRA